MNAYEIQRNQGTHRRNIKNFLLGQGMSLAELDNASKGMDVAVLKDVRVGENQTPEKNFHAVWNQDAEHVSAIVSDKYNLVQHQNVVSEVTEALRNLNIKATASVRTNGDVLVCDIDFPDMLIQVQKGEEFTTGMRVINSYNRTTGIMVLPRLTRLACSNGMVVEFWARGFNVHHSSKLAQDFAKEVPLLLKRMVGSDAKLRAYVESCLADSVEWATAKVIIKTLFKTDKHSDAILNLLHKEYFAEKPSRWNIYNAITAYCTRGQQLSPAMETSFQNKAQVVMTTPLIALVPKQEAA